MFMENKIVNIKIEKIIRSHRKTIALQMTDNATLIVKAPFNVSDEIIMKIITKNKSWIEKKKREIEARDPKHSEKEFVSGEGFLYLGRYYKLEIVNTQEEPLKLKNNRFYLSKTALPEAKEIFIQWYKKEAYEKISERVEWYAKITGYKYNKINITDAKKRWGSCSPNGNLNFSWRIIMAPLRVIDYVVVHELAHTVEKSHGKEFWTKVKIIMPDYEFYQNWLKENGHLLKL